MDYKVTSINSETEHNGGSLVQAQSHAEVRPHVCEMPDCSAVRHSFPGDSKKCISFYFVLSQSFTSKAALHGHIRIHCIGRNVHHPSNSGSVQSGTSHGFTSKDDYPCKVCGK